MEDLAHLKVLRLNMAGAPIDWLTWQEATCLYARELVGWTLGDTLVDITGGHNRQTGRRSSLSLHGIVACKGHMHTRMDHVPRLSKQALLSRDQYHCMYCGKQFTAAQLTQDHIIPLSKGGAHAWTNVITACRRCNQRKGNRSPEECNMPILAVPYKPNRAEYLALVNSKRIRGDQMAFLSAHFSRNWRDH